MRNLASGAHPDDTDILCYGTAGRFPRRDVRSASRRGIPRDPHLSAQRRRPATARHDQRLTPGAECVQDTFGGMT